MARFAALLPRFILLPLAVVLGTATLTFAAQTQITATPPATTTAAAAPAVLVVPDVRNQVYVFAKGTLEDSGFAWRVAGSVQGYAANTVVTQVPAPGSRVLDTGAPVVVLKLARNARYPQKGTPENAAPFAGSAIAYPGAVTPQPAATPAQPKPAAKKPAAKKPAAKKAKVKAKASNRPPAFAVSGAPREPLDEMPLVERARRLERFVGTHKRSDRNVQHWLYQHSWIVTGAKFGWWRGAEALEILVRVDQKVQARWNMGARSGQLARAALAEVKARSK